MPYMKSAFSARSTGVGAYKGQHIAIPESSNPLGHTASYGRDTSHAKPDTSPILIDGSSLDVHFTASHRTRPAAAGSRLRTLASMPALPTLPALPALSALPALPALPVLPFAADFVVESGFYAISALVNRFVDTLEQNIRGALNPAAGRGASSRGRRAGRASQTQLAAHSNADAQIGRAPPVSSRRSHANMNVTPEAIIDLSDIATPVRAANGGRGSRAFFDQDVVILDEVVDLCTPRREAATNTRTRTRTNANRAAPRRRASAAVRPSISIAAINSPPSPSPAPPPTPAQSATTSSPHCGRQWTALGGGGEYGGGDTRIDDEAFKCAVCMESPFKREPTTTKCGHVFCKACITQAIQLSRKCPMCNTKLTQRMLLRLYL